MAVSAASPLLLLLLAAAPGVAAAAAVGLAPPPPSAARRASALLSKLNTTQKLGLLSGVYGLGWNCAVGSSASCERPYVGNVRGWPTLGVPWLALQDGPQGYRDGPYGKYQPGATGTATQWPSGLTVAATWDRALAATWGRAMGAEFRSKGANVQLGPGLNLARVPNGGRNFEYLSGEDPFLGAALAGPVVRGIQSNGVMATAKHYILNNQEWARGNVSADVDERTLMELYQPPFAAAVEAGVGAVMCGYNRINGVYACQSNWTINTQLRGYHGFRGFVMSDWGATGSGSTNNGLTSAGDMANAVHAGMDLEMPGGQFYTPLLLSAAVANGTIKANELENMARRILTSMVKVGIMDIPQPTGHANANATSVEHAAIAEHIAAAAAVLLQNKNATLPLRPADRLAVIGPAAACEAPEPSFGFGWPPTIGCIGAGGGSGGVAVLAGQVPTIATALQRRSAHAVAFANGTSDLDRATHIARDADVAVVVVGTSSSEGSDRASLQLPPDQLRYLSAVAGVQPATVVVVMAPGAVAMGGWSSQVAAIGCWFLPGQSQANAVASVLYGEVNPAGKLPITMPNTDNEVRFTPQQYPGVCRDCPGGPHATYSEKLEVGYRWYLAHPSVKPAFVFGHGLSFTQFSYHDLKVALNTVVTAIVTNVGGKVGAEVAQLYLGYPPSAGEPPKVLRGFTKLALKPGESQTAKFSLTERDLSVWDVGRHDWKMVVGTFGVFVGASSEDIRLTGKLISSP